MGTKSTHGPICFLFERQIWFVNYCIGSRVLLVLRRYIVSWREYFGWPWPEVIFFGKHGDEKFDISFVIRCKLLASVLLWNFFPWLLHSKALRMWWKNYFTHICIVLIILLSIFLWLKNIVILNYNRYKLLKFIPKTEKPWSECW